MHLSHYGMIALALLYMFSIPLLLFSKIDAVTERSNQKIEDCMTTAAYDAVQVVTITDKKAFATRTQQDEALNAFYTSLSASYGVLDSNAKQLVITSNVPFVILIDNDGLYINYGKDYKWGQEYFGNFFTTPIFNYSANYGNYTVQYMLDGTMIIYKDGLKVMEGNYKNVRNQLTNEEVYNSLPFMNDPNMFEEEKQAVITNVVINRTKYYLNELIDTNRITNADYYKNNTRFGNNYNNTQYDITIPLGENGDWARALSGPTVIAFYQGKQSPFVDHTYIGQFALAGGEIAEEQKYYIHKDGSEMTYHVESCSELTNDDLKTFYTSMEKCAELGAYPCMECIK